MQGEIFFQDPRLPFAECRYSTRSTAVFKPHMHTTVSIGAVARGEVHYRVGNETARLRPESLALINPEILHSCNPTGQAERSYYMLYLDVGWCYTVQDSLWDIEEFIPFSIIHLDDEPLYHSYCQTMQSLLTADIHLQEKEQLLVELVSAVMQRGCTLQAETRRCPSTIHHLKSILKEDLHRDLTLVSLAETLETNPYTLLRKFKAETGITPHAYRMNCRIEQAKEQLRQGRDITETALECGFFDQSHLHRHFKAITTVTPQEYRVNFVQDTIR